MARIRPESETLADWEALSARLRRLAGGLTRNDAEADDLTQQALTRLLTVRPQHAGHVGYARSVLVRLWLDQQRTLRRRAKRWAELLIRTRTAASPRDAAEDAEQVERARNAIAQLAPQQRAVLALRLIEELDYEEIAAVLECPVQTVRSNLHLARQNVRRALGEES